MAVPYSLRIRDSVVDVPDGGVSCDVLLGFGWGEILEGAWGKAFGVMTDEVTN